MKTPQHASGPHSAYASMTGYLFQARYALLRGLEEGRHYPGYALSIERFDDVAFEDDGGPFELIQTKHQVLPQSSVGDGCLTRSCTRV